VLLAGRYEVVKAQECLEARVAQIHAEHTAGGLVLNVRKPSHLFEELHVLVFGVQELGLLKKAGATGFHLQECSLGLVGLQSAEMAFLLLIGVVSLP